MTVLVDISLEKLVKVKLRSYIHGKKSVKCKWKSIELKVFFILHIYTFNLQNEIVSLILHHQMTLLKVLD